MKNVTASDARKRWFQLLDEVLEGEVVAIHRKGRRVLLKADEERPKSSRPKYDDLIKSPDADGADSWRWEWAEGDLRSGRDDD